MDGAELDEAAAEAERAFHVFFPPCFSFMCSLLSTFSKLTAAAELIQEHRECFSFLLLTAFWYPSGGLLCSETHFTSRKSHFESLSHATGHLKLDKAEGHFCS